MPSKHGICDITRENNIDKKLEGEPSLSFNTIVRTDKGNYEMVLSMNQEQLQYMVEVGFRTLLGMGVLVLPDITHIPDKQEADDLHKSVLDDWKSKLN